MNNKGELEIAVNKRLIERAVLLFIIIALGIIAFTKPSSPDSELTAQVTALNEQVSQQESELKTLHQQLAEQEAAAEARAPEPVVPVVETPLAPAVTLSGEATYAWDVSGVVLLPEEYNAARIAELIEELADLEERIDDAEGDTRDDLRDQIRDRKDELASLENAPAKYELQSITVTVDNGLAEDQTLNYEMCWPRIECFNLKGKGSFTTPSGETMVHELTIGIPRIVLLEDPQMLRLRLAEGETKVFEEEEVIPVPQ